MIFDAGFGLASHGPVQSDAFWRRPVRRFISEFKTIPRI
jgi:hypothetical protein